MLLDPHRELTIARSKILEVFWIRNSGSVACESPERDGCYVVSVHGQVSVLPCDTATTGFYYIVFFFTWDRAVCRPSRYQQQAGRDGEGT